MKPYILEPKQLVGSMAICFMLASTMLFHEVGAYFIDPNVTFLNVFGRTLSCQAYTVGTLCGFALGYLLQKKLPASKVIPILSLFMLIAAGCFHCSLFFDWPIALITLCQLILSSLGHALLVLMVFKSAFSQQPYPLFDALVTIAYLVVFSELIAQLGFFVVVCFLEPPGIALAQSALIALSLVLYLFAQKQTDFLPTESSAQGEISSPPERAREEMPRANLKPLGFMLLSLGFVLGMMHVLPASSISGPEIRIIPYLAGALIAAFLATSLFRTNQPSAKSVWAALTRATLPLIMIGLLILPLLAGDSKSAALTISETGKNLLFIILTIGALCVSKEANLPAFRTLSWTAIMLFAGNVMGSIASLVIRDSALFNIFSFSLVAVISYVVLTFGVSETGIERGLKNLWGLVPLKSPRGHYNDDLIKACQHLAKERELTNREEEIFTLLAQNKRPSEIKREFTISVSTVRTHVQRIYRKLEVHSNEELIALVNESMKTS